MERLDRYLAMPVEEVVWPTLTSAWEASGATMPQIPSVEEATTVQHQEQGIEAHSLENQPEDPLPENQQIVNTTAVPTGHTTEEENSSDTSSDSDYEMDIDDDDFDQTTPTSVEVDLMEVDEEVAPIINVPRYPKLEEEWRNGIPQHVRRDFLYQVSPNESSY
jgi:hypothetical protein